MRTILKIIAAPFILALILAVAVLSFLSCVAGAVCCGLCGPVSAGDPLPAGRANHRLHRHVRAGVPGFSLWAPGPGRLAGGAPVWCEVCGDGLYGELILTSGHFVQKFGAAAGTDRRLFFLLGKEVRLSLQPTSGPTR